MLKFLEFYHVIPKFIAQEYTCRRIYTHTPKKYIKFFTDLYKQIKFLFKTVHYGCHSQIAREGRCKVRLFKEADNCSKITGWGQENTSIGFLFNTSLDHEEVLSTGLLNKQNKLRAVVLKSPDHSVSII